MDKIKRILNPKTNMIFIIMTSYLICSAIIVLSCWIFIKKKFSCPEGNLILSIYSFIKAGIQEKLVQFRTISFSEHSFRGKSLCFTMFYYDYTIYRFCLYIISSLTPVICLNWLPLTPMNVDGIAFMLYKTPLNCVTMFSREFTHKCFSDKFFSVENIFYISIM